MADENFKIKWKVSDRPTGPYSSFQRRSWPFAEYPSGEIAASLHCDDEYMPSKIKDGNHAPIKIRIAKYKPTGGFEWLSLKKRGATLKEAKEIAKAFIELHQEFLRQDQP